MTSATWHPSGLPFAHQPPFATWRTPSNDHHRLRRYWTTRDLPVHRPPRRPVRVFRNGPTDKYQGRPTILIYSRLNAGNYLTDWPVGSPVSRWTLPAHSIWTSVCWGVVVNLHTSPPNAVQKSTSCAWAAASSGYLPRPSPGHVVVTTPNAQYDWSGIASVYYGQFLTPNASGSRTTGIWRSVFSDGR